MATFGENLRRERELRGVTLEEISAATKISVRFLKSIENEDFSKLPGGIFNRSFIRAYAHFLGIEEESLLAEYQLAAKAKGESDQTRLSFPISQTAHSRGPRSAWTAIVAAVVLLVAGYGLWRYSRGSTPASSPGPRQVSLQKTSPGRAAIAILPKAGSTGPPPSSAPRPNTAGSGPSTEENPPAPPPAAAAAVGGAAVPSTIAPATAAPTPDYGNNLILQLATTERSWVAVDADGKTILQGIIDPNEVKTFKANESFDVLTGNARGVVLTLNGQTLKPLGREGEVKSVHLTWADLKNHNAH